jgi:hypothetical protein
VIAEPRWWYWLGLPFAAVAVGAIGAAVVGLLAGATAFVVCLVVFSLVAMVLIGRADVLRLRFELTADDVLVLGRGAAAERVPLVEVSRAVLGLPPVRRRGKDSPGRSVPTGRDSGMVVHRVRTLVLVLPDGAVLPLSLHRAWLRGGAELADALLKRLGGLVAGPESYRPAELAVLGRSRVRFNVIARASTRRSPG